MTMAMDGGRVRLLAVTALAASLGACAGSSRFDGFAGPSRASSAPVYQQPEPIQATPGMGGPVASGPITSEPLPPPGGYGQPNAATPLPGSVAQTVDPTLAPTDVPPTTGTSPGQQPPVMPGTAGRVATLGERNAAPSRPVSSRDGVVGGWTAREATGSTCRVQLSSSPALDLYRASASGCSNKELQKVTAWDYRDGEVYLYQPGGAVAARLRANDGGSMSGAVSRSGAGLTLSR